MPHTAAAPATPADAWPTVEAALLRAALPFDRNRAWEQATLFAALALSGSATAAAPFRDEAAAAAAACAPSTATCEPPAAASRATSSSSTIDPAAYADTIHTQLLPQRWLNSYPPALARRLHDHHGKAMHAEHADGEDWLVSFSGCAVLLDAATCEALYRDYAAVASARLDAAEEARKQQQQDSRA